MLVCDPIAAEWEPLSTKLDPSLVECDDALERAGNLESLLLEMECSCEDRYVGGESAPPGPLVDADALLETNKSSYQWS